MKYPNLRNTLTLNAASSAACGLALLLAPAALADLIGTVPVWLCQAIGAGLLLFAAEVYWVARKLPGSHRFVKVILAADLAWVGATPLVMLAFADSLSIWGQFLLLDAALAVGVFAFLEWHWLKRSNVAI